jgi:hypothetical protein
MNKLIRQAIEYPYCVDPTHLNRWVLVGRKPRIEHRAGRIPKFEERDETPLDSSED